MDTKRSALAALHAQADACRRCAIATTRNRIVCGVGDPDSPLMIVGEGPGENEDRQGAPFVGRAGELLTKMLAAIGLRRDDVFITNTIKCRASTEENGRVFNRAPMQEEIANCREYLDREIAIVKPRVILALGAPAAKSFLGAGFGITRQRGIWYAGPAGTDLIVTFHPAYILRLTGGQIDAMKRLVWSDLQAVRRKLDELKQAADLPDGLTASVDHDGRPLHPPAQAEELKLF
ncbi:MAG TPA: uracil-DNA glycosylase [Candidatus Eremiobacteraceae bacterium]|nr:uracil-DNA glycosylase [Candidatus Eremiobacteraceae bacterium]